MSVSISHTDKFCVSGETLLQIGRAFEEIERDFDCILNRLNSTLQTVDGDNGDTTLRAIARIGLVAQDVLGDKLHARRLTSLPFEIAERSEKITGKDGDA